MTITYCVGDGLYINMTNRCSNSCTFCIRNFCDSVGDTDSLWLPYEPSREEMLEDIKKRDLSRFSEFVFCGFGEPTMRLEDMLWLCKQIKQLSDIPIRVNTNGQTNLIAGYDTTPLFAGLVDRISISLNAVDAKKYNDLCKSVYGEKAYHSMLEFVGNIKKYVPEVVLSIVSGTTDFEACKKIADDLGLPLRIR